MGKGRLLVVSFRTNLRGALSRTLEGHFEDITFISSPKMMVSTLFIYNPDVVLFDLHQYSDLMGGNDGRDWVKKFIHLYPNIPIILLVEKKFVPVAVECVVDGAYGYVENPWVDERLVFLLTSVCRRDINPSPMVFDRSMQQHFQKFITTDVPLLIVGGDEYKLPIIAKEIHNRSKRGNSPFIHFTPELINGSQLEKELFGYLKGGYKGGNSSYRGLFERGEGGTLFIDDVTKIPLRVQQKILRVIRENTIVQVGSVKPLPVDVRIIFSIYGDAKGMITVGVLSAELYHEISKIDLNHIKNGIRKRFLPLYLKRGLRKIMG